MSFSIDWLIILFEMSYLFCYFLHLTVSFWLFIILFLGARTNNCLHIYIFHFYKVAQCLDALASDLKINFLSQILHSICGVGLPKTWLNRQFLSPNWQVPKVWFQQELTFSVWFFFLCIIRSFFQSKVFAQKLQDHSKNRNAWTN